MPTALADSPAKIARQLLIDLGLAAEASFGAGNRYTGAAWPAFHSAEPDQPDNLVFLVTTQGTDEGFSMIDGENFGFDGFQVTVRANDHDTGWSKASNIKAQLEGVSNKYVNVNGNQYSVGCMVPGNVLDIGKGSPESKRSYFTINCTISMRSLN